MQKKVIYEDDDKKVIKFPGIYRQPRKKRILTNYQESWQSKKPQGLRRPSKFQLFMYGLAASLSFIISIIPETVYGLFIIQFCVIAYLHHWVLMGEEVAVLVAVVLIARWGHKRLEGHHQALKRGWY